MSAPPIIIPCRACGSEITCAELTNPHYSLQDLGLPFVLNCPPGFPNCNQNDFINLKCCDQILSIGVPSGAPPLLRAALLDNLKQQCARLEQTCGGGGNNQKFCNSPQNCTVVCANGPSRGFVVPAGIFCADTQAEADAQAQALACATARRQCKPRIPIPCSSRFLQDWTNAAVTGQTFDISSHSSFDNPTDCINIALTHLAWSLGLTNDGSWFVEAFNTLAPGIVTKTNLWAEDGGNPNVQAALYSDVVNKVVAARQHFNGATYDVWLSFVSGSTGTELSHIAGLTTETRNNLFALVQFIGNGGTEAGWLSSNNTGNSKLFRVDLSGEAIINTLNLPGRCFGLCYSCFTDSFFTIHNNDLLEVDRLTMTLKNTYAGVGAGYQQVEYIKTTSELWLAPFSSFGPGTIAIIAPNTGVVKTTITTLESFPVWSSSQGYAPRFYHETLNTFSFPSPNQGNTGNPYFYYFYDVKTRTIKKQLDVTALYQMGFQDWWGQNFNLDSGSVYLMGGPFNNTTNKGILVIGTS